MNYYFDEVCINEHLALPIALVCMKSSSVKVLFFDCFICVGGRTKYIFNKRGKFPNHAKLTQFIYLHLALIA